MRQIFILIINILFINVIYGQIHIDSLTTELKKLDRLDGEPDTNGAVKHNYINKDSLVLFEVFHDSNGNIIEKNGLAIYAYKYDYKKRLFEKRYYDKNGQLRFTDWPPIVKLKYDDKGNITKIEYFEANNLLNLRTEFDYDDKSRQIEFRNFDGNLEILLIRTYEYKDKGKVVLTRQFDKNRNSRNFRYGVTVKYARYLTDKRETIIEERFMNKDGELVMIEEVGAVFKYSSIRYLYDLRKDLVKIEYYDSNEKKVKESWRNITKN